MTSQAFITFNTNVKIITFYFKKNNIHQKKRKKLGTQIDIVLMGLSDAYNIAGIGLARLFLKAPNIIKHKAF